MRELHKTTVKEEAYELEGSLILAGIHVRVFCQDAHAKQLVYVVAVRPEALKQARAVRRRMFGYPHVARSLVKRLTLVAGLLQRLVGGSGDH